MQISNRLCCQYLPDLSLDSRLDQTRGHLAAVKYIAGQYSFVIPNKGKGSKQAVKQRSLLVLLKTILIYLVYIVGPIRCVLFISLTFLQV